MMDLDAFERASSRATDGAPATLPRGAGAAQVIPSSPRIEFGAYLRELCADAASLSSARDRVTVTCTAAEGLLPTTTAIWLGLIAEQLIKDALENAFPGRRGGRVAVTFGVEGGAWRLMVEDSGVGLRVAAGDRREGLRLVRDLAGELGGRLRVSGVIGGTRCIVAGARPPNRPCGMRREHDASHYMELTRPLGPARSGDEAGAVTRRGGAARRRLAAGVALGWLTVEEALEDTPPPGPSAR